MKTTLFSIHNGKPSTMPKQRENEHFRHSLYNWRVILINLIGQLKHSNIRKEQKLYHLVLNNFMKEDKNASHQNLSTLIFLSFFYSFHWERIKNLKQDVYIKSKIKSFSAYPLKLLDKMKISYT